MAGNDAIRANVLPDIAKIGHFVLLSGLLSQIFHALFFILAATNPIKDIAVQNIGK